MLFVGLALVAFDTDHIKRYVLGTNKLKEIRGASSLLDYINRIVMVQLAESYQAETVYANGGSGLFLIAAEQADIFGKQVQQAYYSITGGGTSVTFVSVLLPEHITNIDDNNINDIFQLLYWRLQEAKLHPLETWALPSHSFMRLCDACGIEYADAAALGREVVRADNEKDDQYCVSCQNKRLRDVNVRDLIKTTEAGRQKPYDEYLWTNVIARLRTMNYFFPLLTERPADFNVFREFKGTKDYLALVYADVNNMGYAIESCNTLALRQNFSRIIDEAIYTSVCTAIAQHLKINDHLKLHEHLDHPVFPFDILLIGGDDVYMVVPPSVALDVALTLSETFHKETQKAFENKKISSAHTLSVGVVLAPIKYPFGLLQEMAETTLNFAKKAGADARAKQKDKDFDDTRINFMIVTGSTSSNFKSVHNAVYHRQNDDTRQDFYATLRPYSPEDLRILLNTIRGKDGANLGRTKLHQIREAVLKMNLTTSVGDGLSVLHNWREKQRNHVVHNVYEFAGRFQMPRSNPDDPVSGFPRVIFPWFKDGTKIYDNHEYTIYRTPLLDFIELYDFLSRDGGDNVEEE